jgi:hypothetical protein
MPASTRLVSRPQGLPCGGTAEDLHNSSANWKFSARHWATLRFLAHFAVKIELGRVNLVIRGAHGLRVKHNQSSVTKPQAQARRRQPDRGLGRRQPLAVAHAARPDR